ncbi:MAG: hypothetical protein MJ219_02990 [Mycoplasmoidaceae bacterium]|nr:hypothetical protein [Mycoplasmoidaceae bacterium]
MYHSKCVDPNVVKYSDEIEKWIEKYTKVLPSLNVSKRFAALMLLENNEYFIAQLKKHCRKQSIAISKLLAKTKDKNYLEQIRQTKINFIEKLLKECQYDEKRYLKVNLTKQNRFDHYFLKK